MASSRRANAERHLAAARQHPALSRTPVFWDVDQITALRAFRSALVAVDELDEEDGGPIKEYRVIYTVREYRWATVYARSEEHAAELLEAHRPTSEIEDIEDDGAVDGHLPGVMDD